MNDLKFTPDKGKTFVDGKSQYPDMLRLALTKQQAFSMAMDLLRFVESSQEQNARYTHEFPLFGQLSKLSDDNAIASHVAKITKSPWLPMTSAPKDGTIVLVVETPNSEVFNVIPAMYANMGGGDPQMGQPAIGCIRWWGVCGSRYTGEGGGECDLPVRYKSLACTPICWMPLPQAEDEAKLRRRLGQLLRSKRV